MVAKRLKLPEINLIVGSRVYSFNTPQVMGIINVTPDSFYAKSRHITPVEVFTTIANMIEAGAAIIDIGAASSRPGAHPCTAQQEWERLSPVLKELRTHFPDTLFSIDTFYAIVVEQACDLIGPFIINDISAGEDDPRLFSVAARLQLPIIAMHKKETPPDANLVAEVHNYFAAVLARAQEAGVPLIILDPGFGFAKDTPQNYTLLSHLSTLFDFPDVLRLIGISRKSMIYKPLCITPDEALSATTALHLYALQQGVDILRVHDVAEAMQAIQLYKFLFH